MENIRNSAIVAPNTPLNLTLEEIANPNEVVKDFFSCFTLDDFREIMALLLESTLSLSDDHLDGVSRADLIFSGKQFIRFTEACYGFYMAHSNQGKNGGIDGK